MNELKPAIVALSIALALGACSSETVDQPPPLQGAAMGGSFELISESGETVRDTDFAGQYRLIYFGYTFCPDVCPVDMQKLGLGMRALEAGDPQLAARVQPIFVSVDPARDTPEILTEFTDNFHPRLLGLTGPQEQIDAMVQAYGSWAQLGEPNEEGNYLVDHMNNVVLYGTQGEPLAIIDMSGSGAEIAGQIERWAR